jgi:quercetin dioxygenase-like cupin family protein
MSKTSLDALARQLLEEARTASSRRAARTVVGGHERTMRQTVIALVGDAQLEEHQNPGEASLLVLSGRLEVRAGENSWDGRTGDLIEIPPSRHSVAAHGEAVFLLTAVPLARPTPRD